MLEKMMEMMPNCLTMMLPKMAMAERTNFVLKMVGILVKHGSVEMSEEDKDIFTQYV